METSDAPEATVKYRIFRRASWPWALAGVALIIAAGAFAGHPISERAREQLGAHVMMVIWFLLGSVGGLLVLVAAVNYGDHIGLDGAGVAHVRMGRKPNRILWQEIERITFHKSQRRPVGTIEIRATRGRRLLLDPRLQRFHELETAVREHAALFHIEVKDYRTRS
ncbi:MAG: hypothetical protein ACUVX8_07715 [Candidatus Zipacnadales bacterium]